MSKLLKLAKSVRGLNVIRRHGHSSTLENAGLKVSNLRPGDRLHNYTVTGVVPVEEFDLTAVRLVHRTGAEHLHVSRNDPDNVFAVALRTTPLDSTGVPHILEHVTLCGSERFPVRDPFFKMITRSLSTFMNAFTANDWTMYPFSTQNARDFENLLGVYLDAVFRPRLRRADFCQEGWRLEHDRLGDLSSPIVLKGVVYNEMKGVFSDPHQVFGQEAQCRLLPSGTYGVVSGGDPKHIPDLTWEQLRAFHGRHYHPSNARFFTYGDMPLEHHLAMIDNLALSKFDEKDVSTSVDPEPRWQSPREARVTCPVDHLAPDPDSDSIVSVSHLLCDVTDVQESFDLSILCSLLVDGEKAPFYRSLIESGLGSDYSPGTGFSNQTRDQTFSVGLQRVHKSDVDKVVKLINETIDKVIEEGFDEQRIEVAMHKIELSLKHQSEKFGLQLILSLIPGWNHGVDPVNLLQVNKYVEGLKSRLVKEPDYFQRLTKKYFKDSQHKLVLVSDPDPEYLEKNRKLEAERLEKIVSGLSDTMKEEIMKEGLELSKMQSTVDDASCLPTLQVGDIPKTHSRTATGCILLRDLGSAQSGPLPTSVQTCVQPTNGVIYLRMTSDVSSLPADLRPYLPLFCHVVTKMGAGKLDYVRQSERVDLKTGGLEAGNLLLDHPSESGKYQNSVSFSSFCLERNFEDMLGLWSDIFLSLSLADRFRFYTLLSGFAAESASSLASSGHQYAMVRAASTLSPFFAMKEGYEGVSQLSFIKNLVSVTASPKEGESSLPFDEEKVDELLDKMKEIASHLFLSEAGRIRASVNASASAMDRALNGFAKFHSEIRNSSRSEPSRLDGQSAPTDDIVYVDQASHGPVFGKSHLEFPFQVNYLGKAFATVPFSHPDHAPLRVLGSILSSKFLHREIREKGGAYGGGSDAGSNAFYFYSYRDPNFSGTLEAFADSVVWAARGRFADADVDEAKLSVFSRVDRPVAPGSRGSRLFLQGITEEQFAEHRQRLLRVSRDEVSRCAAQYLADESKASVAAIGPRNEASSGPGWSVSSDN